METILKKYLFKDKKISITKAAELLGVTRPYLTTIVNGASCGKKLASAIETFSNGKVPFESLVRPEKFYSVSKTLLP